MLLIADQSRDPQYYQKLQLVTATSLAVKSGSAEIVLPIGADIRFWPMPSVQARVHLPPKVLITSNPGNKDIGSLDWLIRKYAVTVLPSVESLKVLRGRQSHAAGPSQ
jgi:hypothetical protein